MEFYRKKYQLPMLYLIGFGMGILYANFIAKNYVTMTGIFHEYFLNQYTQVKIINEDYLWYLLRWRVMPLALAVCVANLGFRRLTAAGILLWTGFAAGILSVAAVLRMGLCGMLLCIAGIFPQYIFYVPAYLLLIRYYYRYPQSEWNGTKTGFTVMMIVAGILSEVYLNPGIVRWFLHSRNVFSHILASGDRKWQKALLLNNSVKRTFCRFYRPCFIRRNMQQPNVRSWLASSAHR